MNGLPSPSNSLEAAVAAAVERRWPSCSNLGAPPSSSDLVELNVGGMMFTTSQTTLECSQPQSMLAALVSGRHGPPRRDTQVRRGAGGGLGGRLQA